MEKAWNSMDVRLYKYMFQAFQHSAGLKRNGKRTGLLRNSGFTRTLSKLFHIGLVWKGQEKAWNSMKLRLNGTFSKLFYRTLVQKGMQDSLQ